MLSLGLEISTDRPKEEGHVKYVSRSQDNRHRLKPRVDSSVFLFGSSYAVIS